MHDFLTTQQTVPPPISLGWFLVMVGLLVWFGWLTLRFYQNTRYQQAFRLIQLVQLIVLYSWYIGYSLPLANSLPVYHCRLAMFALVLLPGKSSLKQYFALLGASGAIFALGYPVFDPYDFPHVTSFSFLVGHYALWVNALIYLLGSYQPGRLSRLQLLGYTLVLNAGLVVINAWTGGNYGLLSDPPIITDTPVWVNYLVVSAILVAALWLVDAGVAWWHRQPAGYSIRLGRRIRILVKK